MSSLWLSLSLSFSLYLSLHMYIYGGDPNWWAHFGQKSQFFPSSIVKIGQEKPHKNVGVFMFPSFFFFLLSAFFCLSFSSLPLLFDILKPKICPPDEVFGYMGETLSLSLSLSRSLPPLPPSLPLPLSPSLPVYVSIYLSIYLSI